MIISTKLGKSQTIVTKNLSNEEKKVYNALGQPMITKTSPNELFKGLTNLYIIKKIVYINLQVS